MTDQPLARVVTLACHDLRTPLATIGGLTKMLLRPSELGEREARFIAMIDAAAAEMTALLDRLGLAARIADGRYDPLLTEVDTLELAASDDERVGVSGHGAVVSTDRDAVASALAWFASAALRHGGLPSIAWHVEGRRLLLAPVPDDAAVAIGGAAGRDLGASVGRMVLEALGASAVLADDGLRVELA